MMRTSNGFKIKKKNYMLLDTCIQVLCVVAKYSRCMRCKYLCQLIDKQYTLDFISCPFFFAWFII